MKRFLICIFLLVAMIPAKAQTEVMAWGNLTGIRILGELIEFETSFRVVEKDWSRMDFTGRERQPTKFSRSGNIAKVNSSVQCVSFEQTVEDKYIETVFKSTDISLTPKERILSDEKDFESTAVSLSFQSDTTRKVEGVYYCFELPANRYADAHVNIEKKQIDIYSNSREITLKFSSNVNAFVREEAGNKVLYIQLLNGNLKKGTKGNLDFTINAFGSIMNGPVEVLVDKNNPGRLFAGFGGNFRLQDSVNDPPVIDYCLKNMRVAFGRAEMPWGSWDPNEDGNPLNDARNGNLNERVQLSMQMAQRLTALGMPVIISAWFPPEWALIKGQKKGRGGVAALRLDNNKTERIYQSLTDYLIYLKENYGVEAHSFSFNESDIGIDVLHTAQEHADFIKGLGAYMASRGLATKMLLGDNSDATTFDFILPALNDPETHKYIAAVSFHSWRGCDDETLKKWAGASQELNVPLIIGEGSTDAAAWRYPQIFLEPTFALYEINLYIRIAAICQPLTILQWQLTSDYSPLWGAGIFGSDGPLRPTQRFWNLQQLADTPEQAFALPVTCNREKEVNCAAFGNISRNEYAVHLVNNGAERTVIIKGLPENCTDIKAFATNSTLSKQEINATKTKGSISVEMPPTSFVTVIAR